MIKKKIGACLSHNRPNKFCRLQRGQYLVKVKQSIQYIFFGIEYELEVDLFANGGSSQFSILGRDAALKLLYHG